MPRRTAASSDDVFINCPFDRDYAPIFEALIFCIRACGFRPRSARELDDGGQLRLEKLLSIIAECRYGIHDLSRTELDEAFELPRFNMPLELGIFLGARRFGSEVQRLKKLLIFDIERYRYQSFISDLAGMDVHAHHGSASKAIEETRNWLANVSRRKLPSSAKLLRLYDRFILELPQICAELEFDPLTIPYVDFENVIATWLLEAAPA